MSSLNEKIQTGSVLRQLRILQKTVNFAKPYGAYNFDDWCLTLSPIALWTLRGETWDTNLGSLAADAVSPMTQVSAGEQLLGESLLGFSEKVVLAEGAFGLTSAVNTKLGAVGYESFSMCCVVDPLYSMYGVDDVRLVCGKVNPSTFELEHGIVVFGTGQAGAVYRGDVVSSLQFDGDGLLAYSYSSSQKTVNFYVAGATASPGTDLAPMPAVGSINTELFVGSYLHGGAQYSLSVDGAPALPFVGRMEGAAFFYGEGSSLDFNRLHLMKSLRTFFMPKFDEDIAPVAY